MKWEELTSKELREFVGGEDVIAVIPVGSLEKHGEHLPLGTDALTVHKVAILAAEREPAVVLPPVYYAYTPEMKQFPGAVSIGESLLLTFLENLCDEVARNGFRKIVLLNGHGGNNALLKTFLQKVLDKDKVYAVYALIEPWAPIRRVIEEVKETTEVGHACEIETSYMLFLFPDLCKMEWAKGPAETAPRPLEPFPAETPVDWPVHSPKGYVGDPTKASKAKGERLFNAWVDATVELIRRVKADRVAASYRANVKS